MAEGKVKSCADCLHNVVCSIWRENECQDASLYHENGECFYGWTSVKDEMPPEHDSVFKKNGEQRIGLMECLKPFPTM